MNHLPFDPTAAASSAGQPGDALSATDHVRVIRSEDLFAGRRVVVIQHADAEYRLLVTRNDRLILQK